MSKPKLTAAERAWLAQFTPVDEKTLTEAAADFMMRIRAQFRKAKVGMTKDGHLEFYMIDRVSGPFSGSFPPWCSSPASSWQNPDFGGEQIHPGGYTPGLIDQGSAHGLTP